MAVYKELLSQKYDREFVPIIAAVSKQTPSEVKLITLDEDKMHFEMIQLKENIEHIIKVKMAKKNQHCVVGVNIAEGKNELLTLLI